jgi:hypothetical protein
MKKINIFSEDNKVKGNWVKFDKVGDTFQGTFISKRTVVNQLSGSDQIIYEFKTEDGEYWNVGGKPGIDVQMKHVKPGQIVGFKFVEERKSQKPAMSPAKIIQVYADEKIVDEGWLLEQAEEDSGPDNGEIDITKALDDMDKKTIVE